MSLQYGAASGPNSTHLTLQVLWSARKGIVNMFSIQQFGGKERGLPLVINARNMEELAGCRGHSWGGPDSAEERPRCGNQARRNLKRQQDSSMGCRSSGIRVERQGAGQRQQPWAQDTAAGCTPSWWAKFVAPVTHYRRGQHAQRNARTGHGAPVRSE